MILLVINIFLTIDIFPLAVGGSNQTSRDLTKEDGRLKMDGGNAEKINLLEDRSRNASALEAEESNSSNPSVQGISEAGVRSFDGLRSDASLYSTQPKILKWNKKQRLNVSMIKIVSSVRRIDAWFDDFSKPIFSLDIGPLSVEDNGAFWSPDEGLVLTTVNLWTGRVTMQDVFATNDFGVYRILNWTLDRILPCSLVILVSLHAGSINFADKAREKFTLLGSSWAKYYLYRDNWILVYIQGGPILIDILLPNLGSSQLYSSPVSSFLSIPQQDIEGDCKSWPRSERWEARRIFCMTYNGLRSLCDCDNPFYFPEEETSLIFDPEKDIPITVMTSEGRFLLLYRLLENLGKQSGLKKGLILIVMDEYDESVQRLAFILGIQTRIHRAEGVGGTRISRVLRFSLYQSIKIFSKVKYFITLEDDVTVSEDFYSFMIQASPIFSMDNSVWCVSAFNVMSYPHSSKDPSLLLRGGNTPGLGWMMPRNVIIEILPKWPPAEIYHNWDFFLSSDAIHRGRICIHPDVLRSNHPFGGGTHFQPSLFMERHYSTRTLNTNRNAVLRPLKEVTKTFYEEELTKKINVAIPIEVTNLDEFKPPASEENIYVIFFNKSIDNYINSTRVLYRAFGVYDGPRIFFPDVEQFYYYNVTILIVTVPCVCSYRIPEGYKFFEAKEEDIQWLNNEEYNTTKNPRFDTHQHGFNLPSFYNQTNINNSSEYQHNDFEFKNSVFYNNEIQED